jgi:hypothetical protein
LSFLLVLFAGKGYYTTPNQEALQMIPQTKINEILKLKASNYSNRQISNICNCSQNTVKKYTEMHTEVRSGYSHQAELLIKQWLLEDRSVFKKQRHTSKRIYERLNNEFFINIPYHTVVRLVKGIKEKLDYDATEENIEDAIVTKGQAQLGCSKIQYRNEKNEIKPAYVLCLAFPYSRAVYSQIIHYTYPEMIFEALQKILNFIGKIPYEINFSCQTKLFKVSETICCPPTSMLYYSFKFAYRYNDKQMLNQAIPITTVENLCRYVKETYLSQKCIRKVATFNPSKDLPQIFDFKAYNRNLLETMYNDFNNRTKTNKTTLTVKDLHKTEFGTMVKLPHKRPINESSFKLKTGKVSAICIDDNFYYFLPPFYCLRDVIVTTTPDKVLVHSLQGNLIQIFERQYPDCDTIQNVKWEDYLGLLIRSTTALFNTTFGLTLPKKLQLFLQSKSNSVRSLYIKNIKKLVDNGITIENAIEKVTEAANLKIDDCDSFNSFMEENK